MKYEPKGPPAYAHQTRALKKIIETKGRTGLLIDPGLGKSRVVLDYASLLALKSQRREARVLVIAPLAAVDTWVLQSEQFVSDQVSVWAEALGGTLKQRAETLASRGGNSFKGTVVNKRGPKPGPRGLHYTKAFAQYVRDCDQVFDSPESFAQGPDVLSDERPRLVLLSANLDTFKSRAMISKSRTMADHMLRAIERFDPDLIVLDEGHKIKNPQSNVSKFAKRLVGVSNRRLLLTGTVMPHSPMDIYAQWRFIDPEAFGTKLADGTVNAPSFGAFRERYAKLGGWMGKETVGFKNLDEMQDIMQKNAVVAKKIDSLDLPPTSDVTVPVDPSPQELRAYQEMVDKLVTELDNNETVSTDNRLTQMLRLRQITSGFIIDDTGTLQDLGQSKVKTIASIVNDNLAGEKRIVVFAFFTHEIKLLTKALAGNDTEVMTITGETPHAMRQKMRKRFGSDSSERFVIIAQIRTMSLAVNELVTASHAVFASMSQQRDDFIQAKDRLNRVGQTRPVTYWYPLMLRTVDEVILRSHRERSNLEGAMLEHIRGSQL